MPGAAILLSDITDMSFITSLIIAWSSYMLFTMYSGSRGVIITDTLMFLLFMTATIVFVVYIVDGFGGISIGNDMGSKPVAITVNTTRKIMMVTSLIILVCCYFFPPNIFWFMLFIGTVFASSWGPVGLMSIWSKRITKDAAFWGMVSGFFMNVIPATIDYLGIYHMPEYYPPVIGTVVSIVVILVISARGKVTREENTYRLRLHRPPAIDIDLAKTKKTLLAPLGLVLYGVAMPLLLLKYYVIPYQIGTGEISPDGSVNWNTGEALITLTVFMLQVPLALLAIKVIWDRYNPRSHRNQKILRRALLRENI